MATDEASTPDKPSTKKACLGCALLLGVVALVIGLIASACESDPEPERSLTTPGPMTVRVLTVGPGRPTVRVAIPRKTSHSELRSIALRMRDGWRSGHGDFATARGDRAWRTQQLRFATTFVFFYLPGMRYERDNAWARVEIPPGGPAKVTIITP